MLLATQKLINRYDSLHKLFNWEYWPIWTVYWPVFLYWFYLSLLERSPFFFMAANPGMENGGLFGVSKMSIYEKLPQDQLPIMRLLYPQNTEDEISVWMKEHQLAYPLFLKPDVGERGLEVTRVESYTDINRWFTAHPVTGILQEAIQLPVEVGLLYYRLPNREHGKISSFMLREMLTVKGDGSRTMAEIIEDYPRARLQKKRLKRKFAADWNKVLKTGEEIVLEHVGNHNRGTTFVNIGQHINEQLLETFDEMSKVLGKDGIFFGRYDIKCESIEDLVQGKNFKIIELNGVASEPAHIYDPGFKLLDAYKVLISQWKDIHAISKQNHKAGVRYMPMIEGFSRLKTYRTYIAGVQMNKIN